MASNKRLNAVITIGGAVTGSLRSALGTTQQGLRKIGDSIRELEREQRSLQRTLKNPGDIAGPVYHLERRYEALTAKISRAKAQQDKMNSAVRAMGVGGAMAASGGRVMGSAMAAGAVVGFPLLAASKRAGEFEYQLQLIGNTADMSRAEIAALGAQIKATSKATGQSSENVVRGIGFLVAAGMDVKTATETVKQAGLAATASGGDIEDLARATFTLNDSLKIAPGKAMAQALDTLSQAGKEGNVELKDMARQLPVLGAGFVSLKMEGREAAATMAAALEVARKGAADADEAANNMKNFIAKIMSPETLKKAKQSFGIDLYKIIKDAQTKGKNPFEAAMTAIIKATGGDQKKIGELFQDMQVQNFLRPMIQSWDEYRRIKEKALGASGVVDRDAEKIRETQKTKVDEAANAFGRLGLAIGALLAPSVSALADTLTPVVGSLTTFVEQHKDAVIWVGKTAATILAGVWAFGAVQSAIGGVKLAFAALRLVMLTNPIGLLLTALAIGAALVYENWEPIKGFFVSLWEGIGKWAGVAWEAIKAAFLNYTAIGLVIKNWDTLRAYFTGLFDDIKATASRAIDWVLEKIAAVGTAWTRTKQFFGFGDSEAPAVSGRATPRTAPPPPPMATGRGGVSYTDNSKKEFHITQQPGQSPRMLAEEVGRIIAEGDRKRANGMLYDAPKGY